MELKQTVDMMGTDKLGAINHGDAIALGIELLVEQCHAASYNRGWWHDPITGESLIPGGLDIFGKEAMTVDARLIKAWFPYVVATKIALIHSEVSEGLEAYRVDAQDDKIPFPGITAEMADVVIRVADLMGCLQEYARVTGEAYNNAYSLGAAIMAKIPFNAGRSDHDLAKRAAPGGKKF